MTGSRSIQHQCFNAIFNNIQDLCHQIARIEGDGLTRLDVDFQPIFFLHVLDRGNQQFQIIILSGHMVAAPHIEPLDAVEMGTELGLDSLQGGFQII